MCLSQAKNQLKYFRYAAGTLALIALVVAAVVTWAGGTQEEQWVFYCGNAKASISTHNSYQQCSATMERNGSPGCGCKRTDGAYAYLNKLADLAFGP